jgi:quinol monooxygenase YgiN
MTVTVLLELEAKEGRGDELAAVVSGSLPETRAFAGSEGAELLRDLDAPDRLLVVERWRAREDQQAYSAWRTEQGSLTALAGLLGSRPSLRFCETLD